MMIEILQASKKLPAAVVRTWLASKENRGQSELASLS